MAKTRVTPLTVVEDFDVLPDRSFRLATGFIAPMMHQFVFQAAPEALHWRIIVTVSLSRHGSEQPVLFEEALAIQGAVQEYPFLLGYLRARHRAISGGEPWHILGFCSQTKLALANFSRKW
jgi:hypothetical protein